METKYKMFVANSLFGLMEGSPSSLERMMNQNFPIHFPDTEFELSVEHVDSKFDNKYNHVYIVTLKVGNDKFQLGRDFGEEYDIDSKHPDEESDLWFYESDKCQSYQQHKKITDAWKKKRNLNT